ncbi:hypothetical protein PA10_00219 [Pseudomonas phage pPa_SNUABM_DT01]|nr:hypothetical protein PA10_00219 [Pseudomonas phage pPa_SNUABM_DT01]
MAEAVTEIEYDTLEQESSVLEMFMAIKNPNAKKVKKLAARLYNELPLEIQKRLCRDIYRAHDPVLYMTTCYNKIHDCAILVKQFIEDGCHGMIFTGKNGTDTYPIKLDTRTNWLNEGKRWDPEQEMIIQHEAVNSWMRDHDKGYFFGKVVLFPTFGFSGEPRIIEMACGDTEGMVKYPGTDFYVKAGAELDVQAVARAQIDMDRRRNEKSKLLDHQLKQEFAKLAK